MSEATHVLVADDDASFRSAVNRLLMSAGYEVTVVSDADQALRRLEDLSFDLLVADVNMPGNEGLAVLRRQRIVPVLIVTGDPGLQSAIDAVRGAAVDYLFKPIDPEQFLARVAEGVRRGRMLRSLRAAEQQLRRQLDAVANLRDAVEVGGLPLLEGSRDALPSELRAVLSEREFEVLQVFRDRPAVSDIASRLHISPHTVRNHFRSIYRKLGVRSKAELMRRVERDPVGRRGHVAN